ncbi:MAG: SusC/RagA family TonB-linked outer membrane protein [Chitinophagaceae bacterium]|nr:SusC/RagA family TonB-linked outer membrane protein [Chitinophagaceae bacterium]
MNTMVRTLFLLSLVLTYQGLLGQSKPDTTKQISVKDSMSTGELLDSIQNSRTGIELFYSNAHINKERILAFPHRIITIGYALNKLASEFNLSYEFTCPNCVSFSRQRQQKEKSDSIRGRVINDLREPVPGATIRDLSTQKSIITRNDGSFMIIRSEKKFSHLSISSVGYDPRTVKIGKQSEITITLYRSFNKLTEVSNIGYVQVPFRSRTADFSTIKGAAPPHTPNILNNLKGMASGLLITHSNGLPNATPAISIRNLISLGNTPGLSNLLRGDPLILLNDNPLVTGALPIGRNASILGDPTLAMEADGLSLLNNINPEDIAEYTILKDADAMAIYGARGANGVILITTKKPVKGKPQMRILFSRGGSGISQKPEMLNTPQYLSMRRAYIKNGGLPFNAKTAPEFYAWDTTRYINWSDEVLGHNSHSTNFHFSITGGSPRFSYGAGTGYFRQTSVLPASFPFSRFTQYLSGNFTPNKKWRISAYVNAALTRDELPLNNLMMATRLAPIAPFPFRNGELAYEENGLPFYNPYGVARNKVTVGSGSVLASAKVEKQLSPAWCFKLGLGANMVRLHELSELPRSANPFLTDSAYFERSVSSFNSTLLEPQLHYTQKDLFRKMEINYLVGATYLRKSVGWSQFKSAKTREDALMYAPATILNGDTADGRGNYSFFGLFSRTNLNLNDRYSVTLTGRLDQSSMLKGKPYTFLWAFGTAWNFAKQGSNPDTPRVIREGKLRVTMGTSANDGSQNYGYLATEFNRNLLKEADPNFTPGISGSNAKFPEKNFSIQCAVDLKVKEWLTISTAYFENRTYNVFTTAMPSATQDAQNLINHNAVVRNYGFEMDIQTMHEPSENKYWICRVLLTWARNRLLYFENLEGSNFKNYFKKGESITAIRGLVSEGLDSRSLYSFQNRNNDSIVSFPQDAIVIGDREPKLFGSFLNNIKLRNFYIDIMFEGRIQQQVSWLQTSYEKNLPGRYSIDALTNHPVMILEPWVQKFIPNTYPEVRESINNAKASDLFVEDASYINLGFVRLSYNLPSNLLKNLPLNGAKIFCEGQNLAVISKSKTKDPRVSSPNGVPAYTSVLIGFSLTL